MGSIAAFAVFAGDVAGIVAAENAAVRLTNSMSIADFFAAFAGDVAGIVAGVRCRGGMHVVNADFFVICGRWRCQSCESDEASGIAVFAGFLFLYSGAVAVVASLVSVFILMEMHPFMGSVRSARRGAYLASCQEAICDMARGSCWPIIIEHSFD